MHLNSMAVLALICVICVVIISVLIVIIKDLRTANTTQAREYNVLRNQYNALQQDYTNYVQIQQKKEEAHAQTQAQIADVATATPNDIAEQLQHRSKSGVRNKNSCS